jgi:hypothetical protein
MFPIASEHSVSVTSPSQSNFSLSFKILQTGYVKNRFIGFNLRQIQDIIDYADIYKIEGAIIFVDFTKAFDSLEWNFMLNKREIGR